MTAPEMTEDLNSSNESALLFRRIVEMLSFLSFRRQVTYSGSVLAVKSLNPPLDDIRTDINRERVFPP